MYQNIYFQREKNLMHLWDSKLGYRTFPYTRYAYQRAENGEYLSIYGDTLTKIYKYNKETPDLFESDVPETTRVLVDLYTDSDLPSDGHRVLTYDIEVEMESGLPDVTIASNTITSIALHDSVSDHYWVLILDVNDKLNRRETDNTTVIPYSDERDLLRGYLNIYEEINPTIVTGWNVDHFDTPYLYNRLKNLFGESQAKRLSPIGECFYSPYRQRYFIGGVSYLDYLALYKNFTYSELDNYRLDTIATAELGEGKIEYSGNLDDLFRTDIDKFIQYNLVDVELIVKLDRKVQFIDLARAICHAGHVPYEDFVFSSKYLEGAILTYLKKKKLVAPNKPPKVESSDEDGDTKFIGAYVKDPIVGKYNWIYDLDLTSLYPSIIMTLNISPETIMGKVSDWDAEEFYKGTKEWYSLDGNDISKENLRKLLDDTRCSIASNGVLYRQDKVGCIPDILDHWFSQRVEFRKLEKKYGHEGDKEKYAFYKKRQLVQKILLNSLYGCLGLKSWRWYNVDNAEATTITGQTVIKKTADILNLKYNKELGGTPLILEMENGDNLELYPNSLVKVKRGSTEMVIPAKELKENDDFLEKVGISV
jgi:DNA polymerase elongation subunit (family B)